MLRNLLLSTHQQNLAETRIKWQKRKHISQLSHSSLLRIVKDSTRNSFDLKQRLKSGLNLLIIGSSWERKDEDVRNADGLELKKDAIKWQFAYFRQRILVHDISVKS